jgi:hypothetical protein
MLMILGYTQMISAKTVSLKVLPKRKYRIFGNLEEKHFRFNSDHVNLLRSNIVQQ